MTSFSLQASVKSPNLSLSRPIILQHTLHVILQALCQQPCLLGTAAPWLCGAAAASAADVLSAVVGLPPIFPGAGGTGELAHLSSPFP